MIFELVVKKSNEIIATIKGRPISTDVLSVYDIEKVIEVEQYLERLFGLRFHINSKDGKH